LTTGNVYGMINKMKVVDNLFMVTSIV